MRELADFLVPQALALQVDVQDNEEIIHLLAAKMEQSSHVKPSFAEAVIARERLMPTGLPLGRKGNVAIPHTDPDHVLQAGLALATLKQPVLFANMEEPEEKIPVTIVFLLAINDKDRQIDILQKIMTLIQDGGALDRLVAARGLDDVKAAILGIKGSSTW